MFFSVPYSLSSEESLNCKTKKQSGLSNLGGEHKEILNYLGLADFKIKFSKSREDILDLRQKNLKINKQYIQKFSFY